VIAPCRCSLYWWCFGGPYCHQLPAKVTAHWGLLLQSVENSPGSCRLTMFIRCMWLTQMICHWPGHLESFSKCVHTEHTFIKMQGSCILPLWHQDLFFFYKCVFEHSAHINCVNPANPFNMNALQLKGTTLLYLTSSKHWETRQKCKSLKGHLAFETSSGVNILVFHNLKLLITENTFGKYLCHLLPVLNSY
jgi:hypothetical protein